jgi:aquaporin Z
VGRGQTRCSLSWSLFRVAPLNGGALGGMFYRWLSEAPAAQVTGVVTPRAPAA